MCERIKCVKRFVIAFLKSAVINHRTRNVRINLTGEVVCNLFFITFLLRRLETGVHLFNGGFKNRPCEAVVEIL